MKILIGSQILGIGSEALLFPMPRVTVEGDQFRRLGVRFKSWGMQPQHIDFEHRFFSDTLFVGEDGEESMDHFMRGIAAMGANTARIHLQLWDFVEGPNKNSLTMKSVALANFLFTLASANKYHLYLIVQGNLTWQPELTPAWYDALPYADRWDVQEFFWSQLASAVVASGNSSGILGYDLTNEPYVSTDPNASWYGTLYGYAFTHLIARGPEVTTQTMRDWITQLKTAIKAVDPNALVTLGALPFYAAYEPINDLLDWVSPHLYLATLFGTPIQPQLDDLLSWVPATKPTLISEMMFNAPPEAVTEYMDTVIESFDGIISGSYGYPPEAYTQPPRYPAPLITEPYIDAIFAASLGIFNSYRNAFLGIDP